MHLEAIPTSGAIAVRQRPPRIHAEPVHRREWPALSVICGLALIIFTGVFGGRVGYDARDLNGLFLLFAVLWAFGYLGQCGKARILPDLFKLGAVFFLLAVTAPLASDVLARTRYPLADPALAAADRWITPGLSWPAMVHGFAQHPRLLVALSYAYGSLNWQPLLLILLLSLLGRSDLGWRFMSYWAAILLITLLISVFVPAFGGYGYFGIAHKDMPNVLCGSAWHTPATLRHLRDGQTIILNSGALEGIVTMPSFHAAAAILLAWAYGKIGYLRWPFIGLNIAMWISAVPIGGHYLVDVLAGSGVAFGVIILARRPCNRQPSRSQCARSTHGFTD